MSPVGLNRRGPLSVRLAPVASVTAPAAAETVAAIAVEARSYKARAAIEVGARPVAAGAPAPAMRMDHAGNAVDRLHGAKVLQGHASPGRGTKRCGASADRGCDAQQSAGAKRQ